jgi:exodeoxyribonuclease VII small subunit
MNQDQLQDRRIFDFAQWEVVASDGTFEEAMAALEAIVEMLDRGQLPLEVSVRCFELGGKLSSRCQQLLKDAQLRVEEVKVALIAEETDAVDAPY